MANEILIVGNAPDWIAQRYAQHFTLHSLSSLKSSPDLAARIRAAVAFDNIGAELIASLPALEMIAVAGAGYERVDLDAARKRGIALTNTPGVTDDAVADMAFALLLAVAREILPGDRHVRDGLWPKGGYPLVPEFSGRAMGILGLGRIGLAIAKRAQGFNLSIAYHNRKSRSDVPYTYCATPRELAAASDYLIVAAPGGDETRHMVDAAVLDALGPQGIIVNISRGSVIDETAMIEALKSKRIRGAGLDVFEFEPQVPEALRALPNTVLMPHRGGGTHETWAAAADLVIANLSAYFAGTPLPTPVDY